MKALVHDHSDGKTLVVYTEEISLFKKLTQWESCLACETYRQYLVSSPWETYVLAFDLHFPHRMSRELQRACEISNSLELGRDPEPHKIVGGVWNTDVRADEKLMFKILIVFIFDCDSKTAHEVSQKLVGVASEETIRKALETLSQPCMPLERHIEKDNYIKYSLRPNYRKGLPSFPSFWVPHKKAGTETTADIAGTEDGLDYCSSFDNILASLNLK